MIRVKLILLGIFCLVAIGLHAQNFDDRNTNLNIGAGLNPFPVFSASIDKGMIEDIFDDGTIGIGGYGGFGFESGGWTHIFLGARGTFHYPIVDDLDTYLGASLGFCYDMNSQWNNEMYFISGVFFGANYPLTDALKVFGELGYKGIGFINVGVTLALDELF